MLRLLFAAALIAPALSSPAAMSPARDALASEPARVPSYPNSSCPIMGKPISLKLFTDTERGRIWVCVNDSERWIGLRRGGLGSGRRGSAAGPSPWVPGSGDLAGAARVDVFGGEAHGDLDGLLVEHGER